VNLPVVSTPAGDVRDLLKGVQPSAVCPSEPQALAAAILRCIERPVRSNGREAIAWLDERAIAARILAIYGRFGGRSASSSSV
jgi:glycosyltransferase involved in cell wall biosynthesis